MEAAMDLAQLNRVVRGAVGLIRGMNIIVLAPGRFELQIFSAIPWFKVPGRILAFLNTFMSRLFHV